MITQCLSIFIGGGLGSILRYLVTLLAKKTLMYPLIGTFFVNIVGCFIIGFVFALTINKINNFPHILRLFITAGFLGGLTTFSTLKHLAL